MKIKEWFLFRIGNYLRSNGYVVYSKLYGNAAIGMDKVVDKINSKVKEYKDINEVEKDLKEEPPIFKIPLGKMTIDSDGLKMESVIPKDSETGKQIMAHFEKNRDKIAGYSLIPKEDNFSKLWTVKKEPFICDDIKDPPITQDQRKKIKKHFEKNLHHFSEQFTFKKTSDNAQGLNEKVIERYKTDIVNNMLYGGEDLRLIMIGGEPWVQRESGRNSTGLETRTFEKLRWRFVTIDKKKKKKKNKFKVSNLK